MPISAVPMELILTSFVLVSPMLVNLLQPSLVTSSSLFCCLWWKMFPASLLSLHKEYCRPFLQRLRGLPTQFPEHAVSRNYLETLVELPWSSATEDRLDLPQAKLDLDRDHYGLENVKKRVLEFLAVRKLKNSLKGEWSCPIAGSTLGTRLLFHNVHLDVTFELLALCLFLLQAQSCVLWEHLELVRPVWAALWPIPWGASSIASLWVGSVISQRSEVTGGPTLVRCLVGLCRD